jgi:FixJ family two-component response regulator
MIHWKSVNWKKSDQQLAAELKTTACSVSRHRNRYANHTSVEWDKINWHHSNKTIAIAIGLSPSTISRKRDQYAKHTKKWVWSDKKQEVKPRRVAYCANGRRQCHLRAKHCKNATGGGCSLALVV